MIISVQIIVFFSLVVLCLLLVEFIKYKRSSFLSNLSIGRVFIPITDILILSGLTYVALISLKHQAVSNIVLYTCVLAYALIMFFYVYSVRKQMYRLGFLDLSNRSLFVESEIYRVTGKKYKVVFINKASWKITKIFLTRYIVVGKNFQNSLSEDTIIRIVLHEIIFKSFYEKAKTITYLIEISLLILNCLLSNFSGGHINNLFIAGNIGIFLLGNAFLAYLKRRFIYLADYRAAALLGKSDIKEAITNYAKSQEQFSSNEIMVLIKVLLNKRIRKLNEY